MIGLMVMPILDEIDDAQYDIVPFDSSGGLGLFSLYAPNIPGQFTNIDFAPAQVGVNRPLLYTSAKGLRVLVQAYTNMAAEDTIRLYVGKTLVATSVLPADHDNLDVVMHIAAKDVPAGVHTLRYEILRKSGQPPEGGNSKSGSRSIRRAATIPSRTCLVINDSSRLDSSWPLVRSLIRMSLPRGSQRSSLGGPS